MPLFFRAAIWVYGLALITDELSQGTPVDFLSPSLCWGILRDA